MKILLRLFIYLLLTQDVGACTQAINTDRITVAGGSVTEILFFLGMEKHIVAADITSNYPPEAKKLPSIGYVRNLSAEGILSLSPTVIIGEDDMGPAEVVTQIKAAGVGILMVDEEHSAGGIINKIRCVADIVGVRAGAETLIIDKLMPKINQLEALASINRAERPRVLFILGMQNGSPIVAGRRVSASGLIAMLGGINIMDAFEGWKPASPEAIVQAAPDVILISDRGLAGFGDLADLKKHPALRYTPAIKNSKVIVMDGMEMLGFGPRTLDAAIDLAQEITR